MAKETRAVATPSRKYATRQGSRFPFGAAVRDGGVNFSIFSRHSTAAELLLYESADGREPFQTIALDPLANRSFLTWHVFVEGLAPGVHYTWRLDGPVDARRGLSFDKRREIADPWARAVTDRLWDRALACSSDGPGRTSLRGVVVGDPLERPDDTASLAKTREECVLYEMHVGGFTRHPSSGVRHPGTFLGVIEKIPYLRSLGVTHVELLPVMAFDAQDVSPSVAAAGHGNYWGYSSHSFWSPHPGYCVAPERGEHVREFREMVGALHAAGIGVILDVVFNHTSEGGAGGPVMNVKGLGAPFFYHTDPMDRSRFLDYTGCGNTVNCAHPAIAGILVDCLEYWASSMGVDGFRFDLASAFARGPGGAPLDDPPLPWGIELSELLIAKWRIAEAWDAGGLYHVGAFPGLSWAEWNGRYRDAIRRFVRGEPGLAGDVATRMAGSADLYEDDGRQPGNSINFVTCHDGFTLADLVSYDRKRNEANGEGNRDGSDDNASWNCGAEGDTGDAKVQALRRRQAKNFMAILLLSQGVPMILAGDEVLRTQRGNNNAYCQDNEISWFDWTLAERNADMLRFTREMIALRKRHPSLRRNRFFTGRPAPGSSRPDVEWHGRRLHEPPWGDPGARFLAFTLAGRSPEEGTLHVVLNMSDERIDAPLPEPSGESFHVAVDTAAAAPGDVSGPKAGPRVEGGVRRVEPRSVVVLEGRRS